jgi:hypothetical protein
MTSNFAGFEARSRPMFVYPRHQREDPGPELLSGSGDSYFCGKWMSSFKPLSNALAPERMGWVVANLPRALLFCRRRMRGVGGRRE